MNLNLTYSRVLIIGTFCCYSCFLKASVVVENFIQVSGFVKTELKDSFKLTPNFDASNALEVGKEYSFKLTNTKGVKDWDPEISLQKNIAVNFESKEVTSKGDIVFTIKPIDISKYEFKLHIIIKEGTYMEKHSFNVREDRVSSSEFVPDYMENPLIILDGKVFTINKKFAKRKLANTISFNKGESIKKYGDKGQDGAVEFSFKSKEELLEGYNSVHSDGRPLPPPPPVPPEIEPIFKVVEDMPRFPGCEDSSKTRDEKRDCAEKKMIDWVYSNLIYPKEAIENKVEGNVYIQFVINEDGTLVEFDVVREIGSGCGDAAKDMMKKMGAELKWIPGNQEGNPVRVLYTLPVKFRLPE